MSGHLWVPPIGGQESYGEEEEKQRERILSKDRSSLQRTEGSSHPNASVSAAPPVQATVQVLVTAGLVHKTLQCGSF